MDSTFIMLLTLGVVFQLLTICIFIYAIFQWHMNKREEALREEILSEFNKSNHQ